MATQVEVPALGESITQAILVRWHKQDGEQVAADETICELETDKTNVDIPSPASGIVRHVKEEGATVSVGEVIARIDEGGSEPEPKAPAERPVKVESAGSPAPVADKEPAVPLTGNFSPAVRRLLEENKLNPADIPPSGPSGRITKQDVLKYIRLREQTGGPRQTGLTPASQVADEPATPSTAAQETEAAAPPITAARPAAPAATASAPPKPVAIDFDASGVRKVPMSKIRKRIAERLVRAQQTAALLTTFNEVDMSAIMELRKKYKESFEKTHNVGLGFMSFFAKAVVMGLKEFPRINAFIEGDDIVYHNYVHLGIAVSTERGLAVPVLRHVENMSFAHIEAEIKRLATNTREGRLSIEELSGGTFTITNGGVFGSLLSTPIINPPQSAILGMHAIQKRPVVIDDKIEIRPMMYVALSYDHRLVDGRESVSFLVRVKQLLEDPARLMLEV